MYDHHTDMQIPMVPEMMSCGDWAGQTLIQNENLRQLVVVGPPESDIEQTLESYKGSKGRQEMWKAINVGIMYKKLSTMIRMIFPGISQAEDC